MNEKYIISNLNKFLQEIYMDINNFDYYLKSSNNEKVINKVLKIQEDYKKSSSRICEFIRQLGGKPVESCECIFNNSEVGSNILDNDILKKICESATKEFNMGCILISDPNFINYKSYNIINLLIKDCQKHINQIENSYIYNSFQ